MPPSPLQDRLEHRVVIAIQAARTRRAVTPAMRSRRRLREPSMQLIYGRLLLIYDFRR